MIEIKHYYLVDLENVGIQGLYGMNMPGEGNEIQIFLSNAAHVATSEVRTDILESKAVIETTFCSVQGKNALDFELAAYFGSVLERPDTERISIISKDGGYRALEDYARKKRKKVIVYQGRSILEAYVAEQSGDNPRMYEKGKSVDFKVIMEDLRKKKEFATPIRDLLEGICDDEAREKVINMIGSDGITKKEIYRGILKLLGKNTGLAAYRAVKPYINKSRTADALQ